MYEMKLNPAKKQLLVTFEGMMNMETATKFLNEFEAKLKSINTADYTLILDGRNQKPSPQDVWPLQEKALKIYTSTPFKEKYTVEIASVVTKNQIKRIGASDFERQFKVITSVDQVK